MPRLCPHALDGRDIVVIMLTANDATAQPGVVSRRLRPGSAVMDGVISPPVNKDRDRMSLAASGGDNSATFPVLTYAKGTCSDDTVCRNISLQALNNTVLELRHERYACSHKDRCGQYALCCGDTINVTGI